MARKTKQQRKRLRRLERGLGAVKQLEREARRPKEGRVRKAAEPRCTCPRDPASDLPHAIKQMLASCPEHGETVRIANDRRKPPDEQGAFLLRGMLAIAVPMWIERVRRLPEQMREARRAACLELIAFGGAGVEALADPAARQKRGRAAAAFNAVAEALAICAFCPGGVTFDGMHWEATREPPPPEPFRRMTPEMDEARPVVQGPERDVGGAGAENA